MREINPSNGTGILVAAVVGAAIGAGVALLFAPYSGRETRGWLGHKSRAIKDRVTSAVEQSRESMLRAAKEIGTDGDSAATSRYL